ncbi:SORL1 [Cordylochernes scorpioides]|uniref:SORL1 n=1 Tax=Cordylochernes scorpioides TaxID=51811 RepID=A0ABY6KRQ9_9ARAC|nr:SORL1 [Cordylochernes scorpioides]
MPSSASPGTSGSAGQEPGRPSIPSPTGVKKSNKNGIQKIILRENSENRIHANPPAGVKDVNLAAARDVTLDLPAGTSSNGAARALRNWADCPEDQGPGADDDFTVVRTKKRRRESANSPTAAAPSSNIGGARTSRRPQSSAGSVPRAQEVRTTRAHITEARARQASSSEDHCIYLEHGPELQPFHYLRALDRMLGGTARVIQVSKVNGHQLLGLANRGLAERLINEGLEVEGTLLRAFPFRKRAERITVGNLPFFVEDSAIISALKPYGRVTSIAPKLMKAGPYTYNDGRREAFIVLREGMTTERLPTRLEIPIKGEAWPAYLSSGIKCSRCHGQGHRRANCPLLAGRANNYRLAPPTSPAGVPSTTTSAPPQRSAAQPPAPAPSSTAMEIPGASHAARAVTPSAAPRPSTPVASAVPMEMAPPAPPPVAPAPSLRAPGSHGPAVPTLDVEMSIEETSTSRAALKTSPAAVPPTPPLPAPQPAGPIPPAPDEEEMTPIMREECMVIEIFKKLKHLTCLRPLYQSGIQPDDIKDAILFIDERESLMARLTPAMRGVLAEFLSAAIEPARGNHPDVSSDLASQNFTTPSMTELSSSTTTALPSVVCTPNQYQCLTGECIWDSAVCDGQKDCTNGDDEILCYRHDNHGQPCPSRKFKCMLSFGCIETALVCDGKKDCADGTDEMGCPTTTPVPGQVCDTVETQDKAATTTTAAPCQGFLCSSGDCIPQTMVCNQIYDCYDRSDELNCTHIHLQPVRWLKVDPKSITTSGFLIMWIPPPINISLSFMPIYLPAYKSERIWVNTSWIQGNSYNFTNMRPSTTYNLTVLIRTQDGYVYPPKPYRPIIQVTTQSRFPEPPTNVTAKIVNKNIEIYWNATGSFVGLYRVYVRPPMSFQTEVPTPHTSVTISSLVFQANTNYTVWVSAVSREGLESLPSPNFILSYNPGPLLHLELTTLNNHTYTLTWNLLPNRRRINTSFSVHYSIKDEDYPYDKDIWRVNASQNSVECHDNHENPRTTLLELEQDTGISKTTIGRIVTEDLRLKKTPAKFIPRFLTNEQKLCRLATCEDMLEMTRTDPEWKDKIITGDETWVYGYDPETKRQSAEWRGQVIGAKRDSQRVVVTVDGLSPGTMYKFQVYVSNIPIGSLMTKIPGTKLPHVSFTVGNITGSSVVANWSQIPALGEGFSYKILTIESGGSLKEVGHTDKPPFLLDQLKTCTNYDLGVRLVGIHGELGPLKIIRPIMTPFDPVKSDSPIPHSSQRLNVTHTRLIWTGTCVFYHKPLPYFVLVKDLELKQDYWLQLAPQTSMLIVLDVVVEPGANYSAQLKIATHPDPRLGTPPFSPKFYFSGPPLPVPTNLQVVYAPGQLLNVTWTEPPNLNFEKAYIVEMSQDLLVHPFRVNKPLFQMEDPTPGVLLTFTVRLITPRGHQSLPSPAAEYKVPIEEVHQAEAVVSLSTGTLAGVVTGVLLVVVGLVALLGVYVVNHRRLQASMITLANSHYDPRSGAVATFHPSAADLGHDNHDEEDDSPMIRGFSDDEPLVVA